MNRFIAKDIYITPFLCIFVIYNILVMGVIYLGSRWEVKYLQQITTKHNKLQYRVDELKLVYLLACV